MKKMMILLAVVVAVACLRAEGGDWDIPTDKEKFHIFIFMGQSNMAGGFKESHLYDDAGNYDPVTDPVTRVLQRRGKEWKPAAHPLTKHVKRSFSIPLPFAQKYLEEIRDPEVKVGLVIKAFGGKAIDNFTRGARFYPGGVSELKKEGTFKGIIWHQGEADTIRVYRFVTYEKKLHGIIADIRADLGIPDLPFVCGQISRYSSNDEPKKEYWSEAIGVVTRALANVGDRVDRAAHIRSAGAGLCREHVRRLVDEKGVPTGKTMRMPNDPVHFNRSGYTTLAERYVNAILDRPSFKNDPVRITALAGRPFKAPLVNEVSDISKDKLTFTATDSPDWLTVGKDGSISGTAPSVGTSTCKVTVTDRSGAVDTSKLLIVAKEPGPPVFSAEAFRRSPAIAGKQYRGSVRHDRVRAWSSELYEPNGDELTFSKVSGPNWLKVSADSSFSGVPGPEDAGKINMWTVKVADADGSAKATYGLEVLGSDTVWVESFDYYPDIRQQAVGEVAHVNADTPMDTWLIKTGSFPVNEPKAYSHLHTSLHAENYKFWRGSLSACAIVLDESRFSAGRGRYRFRFNLFGVSEEDAHFFVSIYDIHTGDVKDSCTIELSNKKLRGVPARVTANGRAKVSKVAERDYRSKDGKGFKDLYFEYDGRGDVLLVFSASRDSSGRTGSAFDDLSIVAVKNASTESPSKKR
ncbi:MAG: sialate O-acetylesterase [Planctomycetota bacterium]